MTKLYRKTAMMVAASAFIGVAAMPQSANALSFPCADRDSLIESLLKRYDETQVAVGLSKRNTEAFEVFASDSGSWTLVMTTTTGKTCVMAAGHSWTKIEQQSKDPET